MRVDVVDLNNDATDELDLDEAVFEAPVREHLFWEVVKWQQAKRRSGTHNSKSRSEVRGGGKKPWAQKGTGRARHGSIRSPLWVGGGMAHGPSPRDYDYNISKKKRRAALRAALSGRAQEGNVRVVEAFDLPEIKTKGARDALESLDATNALVVDTTERDPETGEVQHNEKLRLSVRNLPDVKYLAADGLNVEDILRYEVLVLTQDAVDQLQKELSP
ncbi:MAG: 50S ribosomal protein L4 [Bradymonadaceae bacterium]